MPQEYLQKEIVVPGRSVSFAQSNFNSSSSQRLYLLPSPSSKVGADDSFAKSNSLNESSSSFYASVNNNGGVVIPTPVGGDTVASSSSSIEGHETKSHSLRVSCFGSANMLDSHGFRKILKEAKKSSERL